MSELAAFLESCIAADEEAARAAIVNNDGAWTAGGMDEDGVIRSGGHLLDSNDETVVYDEGAPSYEEAVHMALHDPVRVLADCEALRAVVAERTYHGGPSRPYLIPYEGEGDAILLALAQPFVGRPGWDESWRINTHKETQR